MVVISWKMFEELQRLKSVLVASLSLLQLQMGKEDFVQGLPRGIGQGKQRISEKAGDVLQMSIYIFGLESHKALKELNFLSKQQELTHLMQCVHNG